VSCSLADAGWQNKLTDAGSGGSFNIWVGAGNRDCTKGGDVGDISVSCTNIAGTSTNTSNVTWSNFTQQAVGSLSSHFYVGCRDFTKCGPPGFMSQPNEIDCSIDPSNPIMMCGGNVDASRFLGTGTTFALNCSCGDIRWGFHQSGKWILQLPSPTNGICTIPEK
jgi:hypothetical protein